MKNLFLPLFLLFILNLQAAVPSVSGRSDEAVGTVSSPSDTDPAVEELAAEVALLRQKGSTWDRILARLPRISGYVQTGYEWSETSSTFFLKRVRLNLTGEIAKKLDYRVQIEFCGPKIVDAYIRYRPFDALNFQLGEYKLPFSIENTDYAPLKYELIEYPLSLRKLMGFNDLTGLSATGRDMGAMVYGDLFKRRDFSFVSYNFGIFNGEGINSKDRNKSKDVVARLMVRPFEGMVISGSWYWGEYGADYLKRIRYGAGACYDRGRFVARGEYLFGTTGLPRTAEDTGVETPSEMDSEGWYLLGGWRATRSLMAVARYDTFREDRRVAETRQTNYTAGVVWQPVKHLRCQLNYTYEDYASDTRTNRNVVSLMLSGIF